MPKKDAKTCDSSKQVRLLKGGNPQIPLGYGDSVVRSYIQAMPDWKQSVGRDIDRIITQTVPGVVKAVKWNSPFYGLEKDVWFVSFHCMTRYIKVAFFQGAFLNPIPPVGSKHPNVRYFHIEQSGIPDKVLFADWVRQASQLPGEKM
ncbi:MAG: histidine kinase [Phycisphaerae bacterium]|jgi:hypothetical protein|nr:MAG: histidine kinase [Phycisphaerae bacterium]